MAGQVNIKMLEALRDEYLATVTTAHPTRRAILQEFIEWLNEREKFISECDAKVNAVFDSIPGLERVT